MPHKTSGYADKGEQTNYHAPRDWARWLIAAGLLAFAILVLVSRYLPNLTERVKFFTENALSLCVLAAIVVQAYIYRRQWEVMKTQEGVLERQAKSFEAQVAAMQEQLTAMRKQADSMEGTLHQTSRIVSQNDRAIWAAEDGLRIAEESAQIAREDTFHAQRAYLSIADVSIQNAPRGATFLLTIENTGNTPANDAQILVTGDVRDRPPEPGRKQLDWDSLGLIGPRQSVQRFVLVEYNPEQRQLMLDLKARLYCWGIIRYQTFGVTPNLEFCVNQLFGGDRAGPCPGGNRETWEQEDEEEEGESEREQPN